MLRILSISALALATVALGYGLLRPGEPPPDVASAPPPAAPAVDETLPGERSESELPGPGDLRIGWDGERLTVLANDAPRRRLLRELARTLDFELIDLWAEHPRVSLNARDTGLEAVLARVMGRAPYTLRYAFDAERDGPAPAELIVGGDAQTIAALGDASRSREHREKAEVYAEELGLEVDEVEEALKRRTDPRRLAEEAEQEARRRAYVPRELSPEERTEYLRDREERQIQRKREHLAETESEILEDRRFAVGTLDPSEPEELRLLARAVDDPDWSVRREAAMQLGFGEGSEVTSLLRRLLGDSNPDVVEAAIGSAAFVGDKSALRELEQLARAHQNEDVREKAGRGVRELRDL